MFTHVREKDHDELIDPIFSCIQLGILKYHPPNAKISIRKNRITIQPAGFTQGVERWMNGDSKMDLHNLCPPLFWIRHWVEQHSEEHPQYVDILKYIMSTASAGIDILIQSYDFKNADQIRTKGTGSAIFTLREASMALDLQTSVPHNRNMYINNTIYQDTIRRWPLSALVCIQSLFKQLHHVDTHYADFFVDKLMITNKVISSIETFIIPHHHEFMLSLRYSANTSAQDPSE